MSNSKDRFHLKVAVYLLLEKEGDLLFLRRYKTGWMDGRYTLPAGHLDGDESVTEAMARETKEETGVFLNATSLEVIHTMHRLSADSEYIDFYVRPTKSWKGEPRIGEPEKADDLQWFDPKDLPDSVLENVRLAIELIRKGKSFSEYRVNTNDI